MIRECLTNLEYKDDLFEQIIKNQHKLQRSLIHTKGKDEGSSSSHGNQLPPMQHGALKNLKTNVEKLVGEDFLSKVAMWSLNHEIAHRADLPFSALQIVELCVWEPMPQPQPGEIRMVMVSQPEAPPLDIVQLLDTSKHEVPLTCSSLAIVSVVHEPPIPKHSVIDSFEVEDSTRKDSPTYSSCKDMSPSYSPFLSDGDKRLEDLPFKTFSKEWKKKARCDKIKWSEEEVDVLNKGVKRFDLGH